MKILQRVLLTLLLLPLVAQAELRWNGFVSVGGGIADPDTGNDLGDYSDTFSFHNENVFGLQVSSDIDDKWSVTGQFVSRGNQDYELTYPWLYLGYEQSENSSFKFGRFPRPTYYYSDFLEVGYAYHWTALPNNVYQGLAGSIDGINWVYTPSISGLDFMLETFVGAAKENVDLGGITLDISIDDQIGVAGTITKDWFTLRAGVHKSSPVTENFLDIPLPAPLNNLGGVVTALQSLPVAQFGTGPGIVADALANSENDLTYSVVTLKLEPSDFFLIAEYANLESDSLSTAPTQNRWFASAGYNFGSWIFHVNHSKSNDDMSDISSLIPLVPGVTDGLIALIDALSLGSLMDRETNSIGFKYDFTAGAAFKMELQDIDDNIGPDGKVLRFVFDAVF